MAKREGLRIMEILGFEDVLASETLHELRCSHCGEAVERVVAFEIKLERHYDEAHDVYLCAGCLFKAVVLIGTTGEKGSV